MAVMKSLIGGCIGASLLFSSTAAFAAAPARQVDPWAALSVLNGGASAAAICGSAATTAAATTAVTAAQTPNGCVLPVVDVAAAPAPPPGAPPPPVPVSAAAVSPLFLGLAAVVAAVGIYLAFHISNHQNSVTFTVPISPS